MIIMRPSFVNSLQVDRPLLSEPTLESERERERGGGGCACQCMFCVRKKVRWSANQARLTVIRISSKIPNLRYSKRINTLMQFYFVYFWYFLLKVRNLEAYENHTHTDTHCMQVKPSSLYENV